MEQTNLPRPIARPRPVSLSIQVLRVKPVAELSLPKSTTTSTAGMSYNNRPLSPGGRRINNPGRLSDQTLSNPYYDQRHNSYASPRTSTAGVIPISTQTFINNPPPANTRPEQRFDSYTGRPRRSSLVDTNRGTTGSTNNLPARNRPAVIQQDFARPASPQKVTRDKDYYVTPASSQEPRNSTTHKKLYSVDDGSAKLVADVNIPVQAGGERHHKRRDSIERGGYRTTGVERDRGRRQYHVNGTHNRPRDKSIDDEGAYEYTDPASMYRDTEPRWRDTREANTTTRPRRGSMDRGGATSRERPVSVLDPTFGTRPGAKEIGPPPSTRGWDKINENLGRTRSVRDEARVAQSPTRGRTYQESGAYGDPRDQYYVPPRTNSTDRRTTVHNYDTYEYEDRREPRRPERRHSISRDGRGDRSIERRGFGIRSDFRNESQSRHVARDGRASDESIEHQKYRDSGYLEPQQPHRRDTAPEYTAHDVARLEQERRDRELAQRVQNDEHGRTRERGYSDARDYSKEPRRRDDGPAYGGDYDRAARDREYDRDRERERERIRQLEPPSERERDRHHYRRDTDRDREYSRKENSPRQSGETLSKPGLAQAATGGLAGAAAAFGLSGLLNKVSDKRDKEKEKDDYQDRERPERSERDRPERNSERDRPDRNNERDRPERNNERDRRNGDQDRDREHARERRPGQSTSDEGRERRPGQAASDEGRERNAERDRYKDDRGLGFAFEAPPEPPRSAPPLQAEWNQQYQERKPEWNAPAPTNVERNQDKQTQDRNQERVGQRDFGDRDREPEHKTAEMPGAFVDPEEDYRRRLEQVQKELGRTTHEQRESESDPDRERRRREREQRQREREGRNGAAVAAGVGLDAGINEMPPHPSLRHSLDDQSSTTAPSTVDSSMGGALKRKPSILDQPMSAEPVQIIDNSQSDRRENRVRIVDPPTEEDDRRPRGILKKPTDKFPEDPNAVREGVAPLKDATKKGIPPGARWTKIDRRLVNPEALEAAHERFEERLDCVIVLRVLTKEEIQKLADRTREIRDQRYEEERSERKTARRPQRNRDRRDRDEYEYSDSEDEFKEKAPKMLEAPSTAGASSNADFIRENRDRRHEREREAEPSYMSGGLGRRDESQARY
ncbi:hypothetical protein M409DRAFT_68793 [Zasmidium cellare ATCC 36951]|uniref:DUF8035 domain-containing protein n=1 Tax=Zasmidium cellare ATCC 36951 TaxID=1080233 RepID=A0A6A6C973_ZASCE|nr:uncharacterized protein M409DRAFT_68793 [Zasmidium cellare ATCC 36951]KAF2162790.1 hypothetical protein M409DRAFT_68793 [Zasmidium cellare ATCC 36951]